MDFSAIKTINFQDFKKTIETIPNVIAESRINEVYDKRNTLFAKFTFRVDFKPIPFGVKVEINKGKNSFDYELRLIKSRFNNLEVLGNVFTPKQILTDKMRMLKERREPRDLFDAWYLSQKLTIPFTVSKELQYSKRELMDKLNPLLPKKQRKVLELFIKSNPPEAD